MKIIDLAQRTPEWHEWRNAGVSASEAIVVLERCELKTPYRLYTEKKGITLPDNLEANPFVQRGIRLEATARQSFERRHAKLLLPICAESEAYPFLRASFDGINDEGLPVELKVPMESNFREVQMNGVHSKLYQRYYHQVQQQILVADTDRAYLSFYFNAREAPVDFVIQRDEPLLEALVFNARQFYDCLQKNQPPPVNPEKDIFIPTGKALREWQALAAGYHRLDEKIAELKAKLAPLVNEQDGLELQLVQLMGDFAQAESAGVRINRYVQQGAIDYRAALLALQPNIEADFLETFRKGSAERTRFTVKGEEKATVPFLMEELLATQGGEMWF